MGDLSQTAWPLLARAIQRKTLNWPSLVRHLKSRKCILYTWKWQNSREKQGHKKVLNGRMALKKCISSFMKKHWIRLTLERTLNSVRSRFAKFADIHWKEKHLINVHCAMHPKTNLVHLNRFKNDVITNANRPHLQDTS